MSELLKDGPNPLEVAENWLTPQKVSRFVGSFQARANPIDNLSLEYRLGYDTYDMQTRLYIPRGTPAQPLGEFSLDGDLGRIMGRFEKAVLESLYKQHPSSRLLGKRLGVSHTTIANKLREYGITGGAPGAPL